jgi:hypothetical protein
VEILRAGLATIVRHYEIEVLIGFSPLTALPIKTLSNISNHLYNRSKRRDLRSGKERPEKTPEPFPAVFEFSFRF